MVQDASDTPNRTRLRGGVRVAFVVSSYHSDLTGSMADSAADTLVAAGLERDDLLRIDAPGAFELPILAQALAERDDIHAVLCFGLVLRGETDHDKYISHAVAHAIQRIGLDSGKPILFGLLTCNTIDQARERAARVSHGGQDKGREVARAAIDTLAALHGIRTGAGAGA